MKRIDYEIIDHVPSNDPLWNEWKQCVRAEGWVGCGDDSTLTIIPRFAATRVVLVRNKADGKFIGSVVWTENENVAYVGFYIIRPEYRGLGIGSSIWKQALQRIPKDYIITLRAVEHMAPRYKSGDTPIEGPITRSQRIRVQHLMDIAKNHCLPHLFAKQITALSPKEYQAMLDYDADVTGRDRSELLRQHLDLKFTKGAILLGKSSNGVHGFASATPTGNPHEHLFKVAPIYAQGLAEAFTVIYPLLEQIQTQDPGAIIVIGTCSSSVGEQLLWPLLEEQCILSKIGAYTLSSKRYKNPSDFSRIFCGHSHAAHWEA